MAQYLVTPTPSSQSLFVKISAFSASERCVLLRHFPARKPEARVIVLFVTVELDQCSVYFSAPLFGN